MSCDECKHLVEMQRVRTPRELRSLIKVIKHNIADGTIVEIGNAQYIFSEIDSDGNWPDTVDNEFQCHECKQRFILSVETYHGGGGFWDTLD